MISAKENAALLYHHQMPEYLPIMGQGIVNNALQPTAQKPPKT